jgi:4-amino-4-deoxy-L-arabinose transferase-like glycosyltransferase
MTEGSVLRNYRMELILLAILLLSGFLNIWNLWKIGFDNPYYAACVQSMLANPGLAVFNPFDAAGFVTDPKPPVGIWVQAASAAVFGFSSWSVVLPQALAGTGSVALMYFIVKRPFGKPAGLVAALALAITPVFVTASRFQTMDTQMIFVILLAVWVALKAARDNSPLLLVLSMAIVGIGFNIKMLPAFIVVPAILAVYLLGAGGITGKTRLLHIGLAIAVLVAVSLSWAVAVDMVPADQRPFIGGSGDNTVMGLIINYNGIYRVGGGTVSPGGSGGAPGGGTGGMPSAPVPAGTLPAAQLVPEGGDGTSSPPGGSTNAVASTTTVTRNQIGNPGLLRFFGSGPASQIGWLLPFALIGLLAYARRPGSLSLKGFEDAGYFSERGLTILAFCLWLFPGLLGFSFLPGAWSPYYLAMIAPPLAALVGIGAIAMYREYRGDGIAGWALVAAVLVTGLLQFFWVSGRTGTNPAGYGPLPVVLLIASVLCSGTLAWLRIKKTERAGRHSLSMACLAMAVLFVAPIAWSCVPLAGGSALNDTDRALAGLAGFLLAHDDNRTFIAAVPFDGYKAGTLMLETGRPVMAMGGFEGADQILSAGEMPGLVHQGTVRYIFVPVNYPRVPDAAGATVRNNLAVFSWVSGHCTEVPAAAWNPNGDPVLGQYALYDCSGGAPGGSGT